MANMQNKKIDPETGTFIVTLAKLVLNFLRSIFSKKKPKPKDEQ